MCPNIPESINWVEDKDGCPEIPDIPKKPKLTVNCNSCPCQFADYKTPFILWANIRAFLVNPYNPDYIYRLSQQVQY